MRLPVERTRAHLPVMEKVCVRRFKCGDFYHIHCLWRKIVKYVMHSTKKTYNFAHCLWRLITGLAGWCVAMLNTFIMVIHIPWDLRECSFVVTISITHIDAVQEMCQSFMMLPLRSRGNAVSNFFNPRKLAFLAWFYKLSYGPSRCFFYCF